MWKRYPTAVEARIEALADRAADTTAEERQAVAAILAPQREELERLADEVEVEHSVWRNERPVFDHWERPRAEAAMVEFRVGCSGIWSRADELAALAASFAAIGIGVANFSCKDPEVLARLREPWARVIGGIGPIDRAAAALNDETRDSDYLRPRRYPAAFALLPNVLTADNGPGVATPRHSASDSGAHRLSVTGMNWRGRRRP